MSKDLATIITDAPITVHVDDMAYKDMKQVMSFQCSRV